MILMSGEMTGMTTPSAYGLVSGSAWFTAADLAGLRLPGLSSSKRKVNEQADAERWALKVDRAGAPLARRRSGRGGGWEYNVAVLPAAASAELARRGLLGDGGPAGCNAANDEETAVAAPSQIWSWFDQQPDSVKDEARRRLAVVDMVEALERSGSTRSAAVAAAAAQANVASSTLWKWLEPLTGIAASDRLPLLAPRRQGGGKTAEVDAGAWTFLVSDYLRPERPTFASCYERCLREYAAPRGLRLPHAKTLQRKLEREVDRRAVIARRHGADALRGTIPSQQRTIADLHAMELVNIDGHRWDVFVRWPDGKIARPIMVAIQDVYSRKILSWRIDETESAVSTRLAFADLFRDHGIPKACVLDNGRAFASKLITGGVSNRFRFSVKPEEPTGLLTSLGVKVHWALPFRGSSKPIERAFRDLCDSVAKRPEFAGAYTGNRPDAKPENYGSKAIPLEEFRRVVGAGIAAHNARPGRNTEACAGRLSFDDAFSASYARAPIGKATAEQLRMALLASKVIGCDRKDGSIRAYGNVWWSPAMSALAGRKVILRYDPDNLHAEVHVYGLDGRFLATAALEEKSGFLDAGEAQKRAKKEADLRKAARKAVELQQLLEAEDLAALMVQADAPEPGPAPSVIRPVRVRGSAALKPVEAVQAETPPVQTTNDRLTLAMERMGGLRLVE